jgi:hypothetical protein
MRTQTPPKLGRSVRLLRRICQIAGAASVIDDARVGLARHGVLAAVQRRDTPVVFDWLIDAVSYQGVAGSIAWGYMSSMAGCGGTKSPSLWGASALAIGKIGAELFDYVVAVLRRHRLDLDDIGLAAALREL